MRDDFDALKWFTLELFGFKEENKPKGITADDFSKCIQLSGRSIITKDTSTERNMVQYNTASVPEIEAIIQTNLIALQNLKPPDQFSPAITRRSFESIYTGPTSSEFVEEKYQDVLNSLNARVGVHLKIIQSERGLLSKIKNNVYNYVLGINLQLRFEDVTESIFQQTKERVDKTLSQICPNAIKKFTAAYNRLESTNLAEWSQALSSCRNILKDFADYVFPAQKDPYQLSTGDKLEVTDDKYKNRLLAFIDRESKGRKGKLLKSRLTDLASRIHDLNHILSRGTHEEKDLTLVDVNICVIDTYLLIGSMLNLTDVLHNKKS